MHTEGSFAPETRDAAVERYEALGPTAQLVVKEVARAMGLDADEYERRVTSEVVETAREVLFGAELAVHVGTREEFEAWLEEHDGGSRDGGDTDGDGWAVTELGSKQVANVAWHAVPFASEVVAATFQNEPDAAVGTLRRQAVGRVYRDVV